MRVCARVRVDGYTSPVRDTIQGSGATVDLFRQTKWSDRTKYPRRFGPAGPFCQAIWSGRIILSGGPNRLLHRLLKNFCPPPIHKTRSTPLGRITRKFRQFGQKRNKKVVFREELTFWLKLLTSDVLFYFVSQYTAGNDYSGRHMRWFHYRACYSRYESATPTVVF